MNISDNLEILVTNGKFRQHFPCESDFDVKFGEESTVSVLIE